MNTILVPTDFSRTAEYGTKLAIDISREIDSEIILLNVIHPVRGHSFPASGDINAMLEGETGRFMAELVRKNKERLDALIKKYDEHGVKMTPRIDFEDKVNGISHFIKDHEIDLTVIGTSGSESLTELIFGTHAENVIKVSDSPVITTRKEVSNFYPKNIVLAIDITEEHFGNLEHLKLFADQFDSEVHFLNVLDADTGTGTTTEKLMSIAREKNFPKYTISTMEKGDAVASIQAYVKRINADMLAIFSNGKSGIQKLLFGSKVHDIVNHSEIPVYVISNSSGQ